MRSTFFFVLSVLVLGIRAGKFPVKDLLFVSDVLTYYSYELDEALSMGFTSLSVSKEEWKTMTTKDFTAYKAIIISDPAPGEDPDEISFLAETADIWGPAVTGNIVVHGTDPSQHVAIQLIDNSIRFAAAGKSSSGDHQTGLYLALSQYYHYDETALVPALSYFGNFTVRGDLDCYDDAHIVASAPAIEDLTDEYLSDWGCSVHEAFASYPTVGKNGFQALAIANGVSGLGTQNFANGTYGLPYIISRGATPLGCGDGHWDESIGEECDDGNTKDFDGCSRSCKCESGLPKGDGTCFPSTSGLIRIPGYFYDGYYFPSVYSSIIITVLFKTLWSIVVASTRMIEPFHQLYKEGGASARESLLSDYLSSGFSKESMLNIVRKHWVVNLTILIHLIGTIAVMVASELTTIRSGNLCLTPDEPLKCDLQWVIGVDVARALQGLFGLTAFLILIRIILGRRRDSGVSSYPCTIASMASLLNNPSIIGSFIKIDPEVSSDELADALSNSYYALRRYEPSPGISRYGLVEIAAPETQHWWETGFLAKLTSKKDPAVEPATEEAKKIKPDRSKLWATLILAAFLCAHAILFVVFLFYRLTNNDSIFVARSRYGPRLLLTAATIVLGIGWGQVEGEVRVMTPYRRLAKPNARSRHILEMSLHGVPITTLFSAIWHGNFFHAWVALVAILSQCLTIGVVGIPYNFGVIQQVSLFSSTACLGILVVMIVTIVMVYLWRRTNPDLPRQPDTLANVIMMLCASKMLQHFEGLDHDLNGHGDMKERILDQHFRLRKQTGVDNKERIMIDVVEVESQEKTIQPEKAQQAHGEPNLVEPEIQPQPPQYQPEKRVVNGTPHF